jgi:hypothetical protein
MTKDQEYETQLLDFKMRLLQAEIEMNAMIAENKQRERQGYSLAYTEVDFIELTEKYSIHANAFPSPKF